MDKKGKRLETRPYQCVKTNHYMSGEEKQILVRLLDRAWCDTPTEEAFIQHPITRVVLWLTGLRETVAEQWERIHELEARMSVVNQAVTNWAIKYAKAERKCGSQICCDDPDCPDKKRRKRATRKS